MEPISQMSVFATEYGCCEPRVTNIQTIAATVNDTMVMPGETFSLNGLVGPRTEDKGYVMAPQILQGEFVDAVGGGVSQFATTFYNAVFFGCYDIVDHTPHSFYFSRYPEGREATISWPNPDLVFRNDSDALILIKAYATDNQVSVAFYGNNGGRDCSSESSPSGATSPSRPPSSWRIRARRRAARCSTPPGRRAGPSTSPGRWPSRAGKPTDETWTHTYLPIPTIIRVHPCNMPGATQECPVQVPSVVGLTYGEAQSRLAEAGSDHRRRRDRRGRQRRPGRAWSRPRASGPGTYVAPGTAITVTVGSFTPPPDHHHAPDDCPPPPIRRPSPGNRSLPHDRPGLGRNEPSHRAHSGRSRQPARR